MPSWFFIALGAPLLWAISNIIDKALVSRYFQHKGTGALMIFSAVSGMIVMPFVAIFHPGVTEVSGVNALIMIASGLTTVFGLIPYFYALRRDDASLVVPIFQVIPVFNYILARIFLGEQLTSMQLLAGALIILGAVGISANYSQRRIHLKGKTLSLMLLSSLLMSLTNFLFKKVGLEESFWSTTFWAYVGYSIAALVLFFGIRSYREQFLLVLKDNPKMISLNLFNEGINLVAITLFTFASLLGPLALVSLVNGFQPLFVLLAGLGLTVYFPKILQEDISRREVVQKIIAIAVMLTGAVFLHRAL